MRPQRGISQLKVSDRRRLTTFQSADNAYAVQRILTAPGGNRQHAICCNKFSARKPTSHSRVQCQILFYPSHTTPWNDIYQARCLYHSSTIWQMRTENVKSTISCRKPCRLHSEFRFFNMGSVVDNEDIAKRMALDVTVLAGKRLCIYVTRKAIHSLSTQRFPCSTGP